MKQTIKRWLPLLTLILALVFVLVFRLYEYLSFAALEEYHRQLQQWTQQHYILAVCVFMLLYVVAVAISIPGAIFLTILGGFLFGYLFGTVYVVISATIGACVIFLAVQTALGEWLEKKARGWVWRMEQGFQKNAFNYLLFLRLVPLFPFFIVNIVPALLGVRLRVFAVATLIGIIPGSFVYALVGNGLGELFTLGKRPDLDIIFEPEIFFPIVGLAILSLVPILYKKFKKQKNKNNMES